MRLSSKLTRMAATLLATAMLACTAALPASAEGKEPAEIVSGGSFSIDKVLTKDTNVYTPVTKFYFDVKEADPTTGETREGIAVERGKISVFPDNYLYASVQDGAKDYAKLEADFSTTVRDTESNLAGTSVTVPTTAVNLIPTAFDHAGIYKYSIQEETGNYKGVSYDTGMKYLYVYVGYDKEDKTQAGPLVILNTVVVDLNDSTYENGKTNNITNSYGVGDSSDELGTLTIEKKVTGSQGAKNVDFTFNIKIDGDNNEKYAATVYTKTSAGTYPDTSNEKYVFVSGTAQTISLHDGEKIVITGLSANDTYTVYESEADQNGYTTTVTGATDGKVKDNFVIDPDTNKTVNDYIDADTISANDQGDPSKVADKTVTFTNNREAATPTGVVMNVAPYILLVIIAVAGAFVFLRKRRED